MKVFISDIFLNKQNIYGKNGEMIHFIKTLNEKVTIIFMCDIESVLSIHEYLETMKDFNYFHWKKHFSFLEINDIYLCNKTNVKTLLNELSSPEIYQFSKKENIIHYKNENENENNNNLFLTNIDEINITEFNTINTFVDYGIENSKVEFYEINIEKRFPLVLTDKMKNEKKHIFIHLLNKDYNQLDKVILALGKIREKVHVTFYNPIHEYIYKKVKLSEFTLDNNLLTYKLRNEKISFNLPENYIEVDKDMEVDIKIKLSAEEDFYINNDNYRLLLDLYCDEYDFIDSYFEDDMELYEKIYNSDIYIPISNDFCVLSILSQKYKTYTLFLNDSDINKEYCIYGKILTQMTKDVCYNIIEKKIEKVLIVDEIIDTVNEYFENENNPMFQYTKEIADVLY
jgi:hypothetical protein